MKYLCLAGNSNGLGYDVHLPVHSGSIRIPMALNLRFDISPDVISTEVQLEETLLLNTRTLAYFGLDPLGSMLWRGMQACQDADEVIALAAETSGRNVVELEQLMQTILSGMERSKILSLSKIDAAGGHSPA